MTTTFVTGTAEMKRRDYMQSGFSHEQPLDGEPNLPTRGTEGQCSCCPYGYHIDLDFLNFCHDLEKGSTLKHLKRIQRTKRNLRKSMELMLLEQEGNQADPSSAPPDVVSSSEAERLLHMINYEHSATQHILRQIDSVVSTSNSYREKSSDRTSDGQELRSHEASFQGSPGQGEYEAEPWSPPPPSGLPRTDSMTSLSTLSTTSNEYSFLHQAEVIRQQEEYSRHQRTTSQVVENPVLEMATAEMKQYSTMSTAQLADSKQYSTMSSAQLADSKQYSTMSTAQLADSKQYSTNVSALLADTKKYSTVYSAQLADKNNYSTTSSAQLADAEPEKTIERSPPRQQIKPQASTASDSSVVHFHGTPSEDVETSLHSMKEALNTSLQRSKVLEEQVKAIPILQVRISVLKEEKRLLNLQLKANQTTKPPTKSIGVGEDSINLPAVISSSYFDATSTLKKYPELKSPPVSLPKPVLKTSVAVGDHSILEPYCLQPVLPVTCVIRNKEYFVNKKSKLILEQERVMLTKLPEISVKKSFQDVAIVSKDRVIASQPLSKLSESHQMINESRKDSSNIVLTRTVGVGDGNVWEGLQTQVHEKELRTVIIGGSQVQAKRNVGIECRPSTRDVGVFFMCDDQKPETRTVGVNVSYDTTGVLTSFDFKGETELRLALQDVLHKNVRSVGTNCVMKATTMDIGTVTSHDSGISVGCGDESHRVDVEIRPTTVWKSTAVMARPEVGHRYTSTDVDWMLDASTNTSQTLTYHKSVMTDKQKVSLASTNTELTRTHQTGNQTDQQIFLNLDQIKHESSNTDQVARHSMGVSTDILPTQNVSVNTVEKVSTLFHESQNYANIIKVEDLGTFSRSENNKDFKRSTAMNVSILGANQSDEATLTSLISSSTENTRSPSSYGTSSTSSTTSATTHGAQTTQKGADMFQGKSEYTKKSSRFDYGNNHYQSLEISTRSTPYSQSHRVSQEKQVTADQEIHLQKNKTPEVSTTENPEDKFSETIVEHFLLTKDGKKLISEEKITTSALGTNRSVTHYNGDGHYTKEHPTNSISQDTFDVGGYNYGSSSWDRTDASTGQVSSSLNIVTGKSVEGISRNLDESKKIAMASLSSFENSSTSQSQDHHQNSSILTGADTRTGQRTILESHQEAKGRSQITAPGHTGKDTIAEEGSEVTFEAVRDVTVHRPYTESSYASTAVSSTMTASDGSWQSASKNVNLHGSIETEETKEYEEDGHTYGKMVGIKDSLTRYRDIKDSLTRHSDITDSFTRHSETIDSLTRHSETKDFENELHRSSTETYSIPALSTSQNQTEFAVGSRALSERTSAWSQVTSEDNKVSEQKPLQLKSIMKHHTDTSCSGSKRGISFAASVTGGTGSSSEDGLDESSGTESGDSYDEGSYDGQDCKVVYYNKEENTTVGLSESQLTSQNIRESYEMSNEIKNACQVMGTYLTDSTSIQTKQLNDSQSLVLQEWFLISSHKLSSVHRVEDFLTAVSEILPQLMEVVVNMTDANDNTALHYCISHGNFEVASLLLDTGLCQVDKRNKAGYTPIMLTGLTIIQNQDQMEVVKALLSLGDINAKATSTQQTALMLAASHGREELVKLLVEAGADLNLQDEDGSTALMCACEHGHMDIVSLLLSQARLDVNIKDHENSTALNIAMDAGHKDIGVLLYKHLNFSKPPSP